VGEKRLKGRGGVRTAQCIKKEYLEKDVTDGRKVGLVLRDIKAHLYPSAGCQSGGGHEKKNRKVAMVFLSRA